MVDAQPELALVAKALNENGLEAIPIGNMAAALHGAPVTTVDIDLFFRKNPRNMQKLKKVADALGSVILRPYYPIAALYRLHRDRDGLRFCFRCRVDGAPVLEVVRGGAKPYRIGGQNLLAASLSDIVAINEAIHRNPLLKAESERALIGLIRYRLSLPPEKRLNCLRRKIGLRATCL